MELKSDGLTQNTDGIHACTGLFSCKSDLGSSQRGPMDSVTFQKGISTLAGSQFPDPGPEEGALVLSPLQNGVHPKESGSTYRQVLYI